MTIRTGKPEDARSIVILLEQLGHPLSERDVLDKIEQFNAPNYCLLICEVDGKVAGFISLHWFDKFHSIGMAGRITALCVEEEVRAMGIGGALVDAAEKFFTEKGCREVEVTSNMRRALTPDFYRKHGFIENSRHYVKSLQ